MITSLEIVDTAVKVGLGACISAVSSYALAQANHQREAGKERTQRRRELLESVAEQTEAFSHSALRYWALMAEWTRYQIRGKEIPEERLQMAEETRSELFDAFRNLSSAEAKLLLLGEGDAQALLRDYGEAVVVMARDAYVGRKGLTEERMLQHRAEFLQNRKALFTKLSEVYRVDKASSNG